MTRYLAIALAALLALSAALGWGLLKSRETIGEKNAALLEAAGALKVAAAEIAGRDRIILTNADREGVDATETASFWKGQSNAAFKAGFAACPRGVPASGGMRDLRALQADGAYGGSYSMSVKPEG